MKRTLLLFSMLLISARAFAADSMLISGASNMIFPVLEIGVGARLSAIGETYIPKNADSSSVFWNPAGLPEMPVSDIQINYESRMVGSAYTGICGGIKMDNAALGMGLMYIDYGEFSLRDDMGYQTGEKARPFELLTAAAYGLKINSSLSAGAGAKLVYQDTAGYMVVGGAFDTGVLVKTGVVTTSLVLRNIGGGDIYFGPMSFRAGITASIIDEPEQSFVAGAEFKNIFFDCTYFSLGGEYTFFNAVSIRTGYMGKLTEDGFTALSGITAGAGIAVGAFRLDYAFVPFGELGASHKVSLITMLGTPPMRENAVQTEVKAAEENLQQEDKAKTLATVNGYLQEAKTDPLNPLIWKKLGAVYRRAGYNAYAVKCFEKAIKLDAGLAAELEPLIQILKEEK